MELAKYADAREDITNCLRGISPLSKGIIYAIARQPQECVAELGPWGSLASVVPQVSFGGKYGGFSNFYFANPVTPGFTIKPFPTAWHGLVIVMSALCWYHPCSA
jgi:hypothetical protein